MLPDEDLTQRMLGAADEAQHAPQRGSSGGTGDDACGRGTESSAVTRLRFLLQRPPPLRDGTTRCASTTIHSNAIGVHALPTQTLWPPTPRQCRLISLSRLPFFQTHTFSHEH